MCRALLYLGHPVCIDELLYLPDSSLIRQSYDPQQLAMLNLAGFGMMAWSEQFARPTAPLSYRSIELPIFDRNLKSLATQLESHCVLAHVRGIPYTSEADFGRHNLHPFHFPSQSWGMAHNGDLAQFAELRHRLSPHIRPELARQIGGTTDSEWVYALVMSQLEVTPEVSSADICAAIRRAISLLKEARRAHGVDVSSSMNLFFSNGHELVALRYTFNFGCYPTDDPARFNENSLRYLSLWYTVGESYGFVDGEWKVSGGSDQAACVLVASEPLTRDYAGWVEVPEEHLLRVEGPPDRRSIELEPLG